MAPTWPIRRNCLKSTVVSVPTWGHNLTVRSGVRTANLVFACSRKESGYVMSLLRSFITPYRKIGCGKSTSWHGGLTKAASEFLTAGVSPETKWFVAGIPLIWFRRLAMGTLRWMVALGASQRFSARLNISFFAGLITESYRQQHDGAKLKSNEAKPTRIKARLQALTMDLVKKKEI